MATSCTRIALAGPRRRRRSPERRSGRRFRVNTTIRPGHDGRVQLLACVEPALGRLRATPADAQPASGVSSSSNGLDLGCRVAKASVPLRAATTESGPERDRRAEVDRLPSRRSAASWASTAGRGRGRWPAWSGTSTQAASAADRSAPLNGEVDRRARCGASVAVGTADPGIDVIAALLPESRRGAGHKLDPLQPFDVLIAVHLGDHEPRSARRARGRAAPRPSCGRASRRQHRLAKRQRVRVRLLHRDEVDVPRVRKRLDHVPQRRSRRPFQCTFPTVQPVTQ